MKRGRGRECQIRGYNGKPCYKDTGRSKQIVLATRRDEATGVVITVLAGPPEKPTPKAKPWCGVR